MNREAQDHFDVGLRMFDRNMLEDALSCFSAAVRLSPDNDEFLHYRGFIHKRLMQYELAIADFSRSIERGSNPEFAFANRGECFQLIKEFDAAEIDYSAAIQLSPTSAMFRYGRGRLYEDWACDVPQIELWRKSRDDFEKAWNLDQAPRRIWHTLILILATCPEDEIRDSNRAALLSGILLKRPECSWKDCTAAAAAFADSGRWDEAITCAERSVNEAPEQFKESRRERLEQFRRHEPFRRKVNT